MRSHANWRRNVWLAAAILSCFLALERIAVAHPDNDSTEPAKGSSAEVGSGEQSTPPAAVPGFPEIDQLRAGAVKSEPPDEPLGGKTMKGTPIWPRTADCFPAESRDLFWEMDRVPDGKDKKLRSLNFDANNDDHITDVDPTRPQSGNERDAIRGRNTWILWAGGNEGFWNWLAQDGYGFMDFLVALDSRGRGSRLKRLGVINQPGFRANSDRSKKIRGLYLDLPVDDKGGQKMKPPDWDKAADNRRVPEPTDHQGFKLFEPGDRKTYDETLELMKDLNDGVDPQIYGYASGVVGLRLFLNPDFFGQGEYADKARKHWGQRVEMSRSDAFYTDPTVSADPELVRPFRVGMSCGFCHVGPHPLNPPDDPEAPKWENLSSIIGNQFWKPQPLFANRIPPSSFLYHFLASQQPGTIDTSLISTDQINNSNTINAVFEVTARLQRAGLNTSADQSPNPPEKQSDANLRLPNIEDSVPAILDPSAIDPRQRWRHTARILLDGSDSIGAFGALARVYLNIGTYYEEWNTCHNPVIGFRTQRPFALETCQRNSVYWQVNERFRAHYLAAFFTLVHEKAPEKKTDKKEPQKISGQEQPAQDKSAEPQPEQEKPAENQPRQKDPAEAAAVDYHDATQAMHLLAAKNGDGVTQSPAVEAVFAFDSEDDRKQGREIWLDHCAICHSSKQPKGFALSFDRKNPGESWRTASAHDLNLTLPYDGADWEDFKKSPAYATYKRELRKLVECEGGPLDRDPKTDNHGFWKLNYLSTDIRVPLTLVGTNPARGLGTNAVSGHVWDNFSSDTYKDLPPIGVLSYTDVVDHKAAFFNAPGGGRGYYRPATHVSLWSTAPFLHNNAMGLYLDDPSVEGRLVQFFDSIRRMLWKDKRASKTLVLSDKERAWVERELKDHKPQPIDPEMLVVRPGDLRQTDPAIAGDDPGFVYRVPQDTYFEIAAPYTNDLIRGILGPFWTQLVAWLGWLLAFVAMFLLSYSSRVRILGIGLVFLAVAAATFLLVSGLGGTGGTRTAVIVMGMMNLLYFSRWTWWLWVLGVGAFGLLLILAKPFESKAPFWGIVLLAPAILAILVLAVLAKFYLPEGLWLALLVIFAVGAWSVWRWRPPTLATFTRALMLVLAVAMALGGYASYRIVHGQTLITLPIANVTFGPFPVRLGPIPRGVPVNLLMNIDPDSKEFAKGAVAMTTAIAKIRAKHLEGHQAYDAFMRDAGPALIEASKCPDFQLDHGHLFGEALSDSQKEQLIAFLKTL